MTSNNNHHRKVFAIISDYDGTLVPTTATRANDRNNRIAERLGKLFLEISRQIPVCVPSSKDYRFLHDKVPFAKIILCILGIETVVVGRDNNNPSSSDTAAKILSRHLLVDKDDSLRSNDSILNHQADNVASRFLEIEIFSSSLITTCQTSRFYLGGNKIGG
jgi:hypothetical protein